MEEFLEEGRKRKTEPRIELLLGEVNSVVRGFLCGHGVPIHQLNGDVIREVEALVELPLVQFVSGLPRTRLFGSTLPTWPSRAGRSYIFFHSHGRAWGRDKTYMPQCRQSEKCYPAPLLCGQRLERPRITSLPKSATSLRSTPNPTPEAIQPFTGMTKGQQKLQ